MFKHRKSFCVFIVLFILTSMFAVSSFKVKPVNAADINSRMLPFTNSFEEEEGYGSWAIEGTVDINSVYASDGSRSANVTCTETNYNNKLFRYLEYGYAYGFVFSSDFYFTELDFQPTEDYPMVDLIAINMLLQACVYNNLGTMRWAVVNGITPDLDPIITIIDDAGPLNPALGTWFTLKFQMEKYSTTDWTCQFYVNNTLLWEGTYSPSRAIDMLSLGVSSAYTTEEFEVKCYFDNVCAYAYAPVNEENMFCNGDFETGNLVGWGGWSGGFSTFSHSGLYSGHIDYSSSLTQCFPNPVQLYTITEFTFWVYSEIPTYILVHVSYIDDSGSHDLEWGLDELIPYSNQWCQVDMNAAIIDELGNASISIFGISFFAVEFSETYFDDFVLKVELPEAELRLAYSFDNETSDLAVDWSGEGNDGYITGSTRTLNGYYGMGLLFDSDDYVDVLDSETLDLTDNFAFSLWVYPNSITDCVLLDKPSAYGLLLNSDGSLTVMLNDELYNTTSNVITTSTWKHILVVRSGFDVEVYINQNLVYSFTFSGTITATAYNLIIGYSFQGVIDELKIATGYLETFNEPIAEYPYAYNCYIDTTACSWILTTLSYNFTGVFIQQNSSDPITYAEIIFNDGFDDLGLGFNAITNTYTIYNGSDVAKITLISRYNSTSGNALILQAKIRIERPIQSAVDVDVELYCEALSGKEDELVIPGRFSIYGIGGVTETTVVGDGAQIAGGSIFDVMAQNSSLTDDGSSIRVNTIVPSFQHIHLLVHLYQSANWLGYWDCPTDCSNTGYLEYGVDYMFRNCEWVEGWKVRISVVDGEASEYDAYVALNCSWYNRGEYVKSDIIYALYEATQESHLSTQFSLYIDLWISDSESSSNVAGRVSSVYYGMTQTGWWLWSTWSPVNGLMSSSSFTDNLYDADGQITTASTLKIFRVWTKIAKVSGGEGTNLCDEHLWAAQVETLQIKTLPYNIELIGISTPVFQPTTTPDMPLGFFASLGNIISKALDSIYYAIVTLTQGAYSITASVIDSVFSLFGITGFTATMSSYLNSIAQFFSDSITFIINLITTFFTVLSNIAMFLITWFGKFIDTLIQIGNLVVGILNGTAEVTTGLGNIWSLISIDQWMAFIPIILVIYWFLSIDQRAKQYGGGWVSIFMSDVNNMISVFSFILDLAWRVVNTVIDLVMRFINVFL